MRMRSKPVVKTPLHQSRPQSPSLLRMTEGEIARLRSQESSEGLGSRMTVTPPL